MYISPYIVQTLHEDRIRDAQPYAQKRIISEKPSISLFSRISALMHSRDQRNTSEARRAHAI